MPMTDSAGLKSDESSRRCGRRDTPIWRRNPTRAFDSGEK